MSEEPSLEENADEHHEDVGVREKLLEVLKSSVVALRDETKTRLELATQAAELYKNASILDHAPRPRGSDHPIKNAPPFFSNMQVAFMKSIAPEYETTEKLLKRLTSYIGAQRNVEKTKWIYRGIDVTPVGFTSFTLRQSLSKFMEVFVEMGLVKKPPPKKQAESPVKIVEQEKSKRQKTTKTK